MFDEKSIKNYSCLTRNYQNADYQYDLLMSFIKDFEARLDEEHEIAIKLTSFGQAITMEVDSIGYANPSLIIFNGFINSKESMLLQHISQLNFLIISIKKTDESRPARRIGFVPPDEV